jgi:hypothetical protein
LVLVTEGGPTFSTNSEAPQEERSPKRDTLERLWLERAEHQVAEERH